MSKMKVTVDKIISLSEEDCVDELQKHLALLSDDQVCILCTIDANGLKYFMCEVT